AGQELLCFPCKNVCFSRRTASAWLTPHRPNWPKLTSPKWLQRGCGWQRPRLIKRSGRIRSENDAVEPEPHRNGLPRSQFRGIYRHVHKLLSVIHLGDNAGG